MKRFWLLGWLLFWVISVSSQEVYDSLQTFYRAGSSRIDTLFMRNGESMASFFQRNLTRFNHPDFELKGIIVIGSSSPEGSLSANEALALRRAQSLSTYIKAQLPLEEHQIEVTSVGVNWQKLTELVMNTYDMPNQKKVLDVLQKGYYHDERLRRIKRVNRGIPYRWMAKHLFPHLRFSQVILFYDVNQPPVPLVLEKPEEPLVALAEVDASIPQIVSVVATPPHQPIKDKKPRYWSLKTNALYDVMLIPNVGIEYYIDKQWSVTANWMYAWWSNSGKDNFWRVYGGDVEVRRWFGKAAEEKPLQGHHVGVYGQLLTYDFELGGRGYLGDKWSYAVGVAYGYSMPIARRLNLDFSLGIGYLSGKYQEYTPVEGHYVWQATKNRRWFGPTKAEVSLVWLWGNGNENKQKGGRR